MAAHGAVVRAILGLILSGAAVTGQTGGSPGKMIVCYVTNWAQYRTGGFQFLPSHVNASLCSHVFFAFAKINTASNTIEGLERNDVSVMYPALQALKAGQPSLELVLSLGGATASASAWLSVSSDEKVVAFSRNVASFLRSRRFDGFDVDWEFPNSTTSSSYVRLVRALRAAFDPVQPGEKNLTLYCAVTANSDEVANYNPKVLATVMDKILIMAYDFYGTWSAKIGHHSPLNVSSVEPPGSILSQHVAVEAWRSAGVPLSQLVLGVSSYGRSFLLTGLNRHQPGDDHSGQAPEGGPFTKANGTYAYYEICSFSQNASSSWTEAFMNEAYVPYAYGLVKGQPVWVGYDNEYSLRIKTNYVKARGMAGIMMWSLDFDDFTGTACKPGLKYPLLSAINDVMRETSIPTFTFPTLTTMATGTSTLATGTSTMATGTSTLAARTTAKNSVVTVGKPVNAATVCAIQTATVLSSLFVVGIFVCTF